jgi:hypothetical protein
MLTEPLLNALATNSGFWQFSGSEKKGRGSAMKNKKYLEEENCF